MNDDASPVWEDQDLRVHAICLFESTANRVNIFFDARRGKPMMSLEECNRFLHGMAKTLKPSKDCAKCNPGLVAIDQRDVACDRCLYRDRPVPPRTHLTIKDEPVRAFGIAWSPAAKVYAKRIAEGFQACNELGDSFLEEHDLHGVLVHRLENGSDVCGDMLDIRQTDPDDDDDDDSGFYAEAA